MIEAHSQVLLIWAKLANVLLETNALEASERKRMGFNLSSGGLSAIVPLRARAALASSHTGNRYVGC